MTASTAYVHVKTLEDGHSESINIVAFSPCGDYLASGSDDHSLIVWRISDATQLCRFTFDSPVNFLLWHPTLTIRNTIFCGCDDGLVFKMSDFSVARFTGRPIKLGVKGSVHCLDFEPLNRVLAVGIANEVRIAREMTSSHSEKIYAGNSKIAPPGFSLAEGTEDRRVRPRRVHFFEGGQKLIVTYLNHGIIAWDLSTGSQIWRIPPFKGAPQIASSALCLNINALVVQTLQGNLLYYRLGRGIPTRKFPFTENSAHNYPLTVSFLQQGRAIVCGSNNGNVHIWRTITGEIFQVLTHNNDIVQAVATCDQGSFSLIATASALKGQKTYINLWRAKSERKTFKMGLSFFTKVFFATFMLAGLAYLLHAHFDPLDDTRWFSSYPIAVMAKTIAFQKRLSLLWNGLEWVRIGACGCMSIQI
ncbi:WD40-repeat-containing domain protein [Hygrophoropsis aurantiaca]|uniref:WD40-repeat-containing domain protein n=1 Tax=Hygrophoropsis aurantiaca TaxID=72124 RepID=A0ACB7ZPZ6_9AGAM|nr:WD40-repeat-containing domain protein [Hygrophoropsis aurantiaca]